ncbi:MAG: acetyl-CoA carboxylase biotin carboxyl carrier protein [Candidatus Izemoplasmatales bacterium]
MDIKQFRKIVKEFEKSTIHKLEIIEKDFTVKMEKNEEKQVLVEPVQTKTISPSSSPEIPSPKENNFTKVKSPLVGTYYHSPSPDNPAFVKVNQTVSKGDVLCIVEAMKVMNEIRSPIDGVIKDIKIKNETMVEYGQVIMEIEAL